MSIQASPGSTGLDGVHAAREFTPLQIGKYPVIRELARGATSHVYLARDPFGNRDVAIKLVYPDPRNPSAMEKRFQKLFMNEAALAGKLIHPHIVAIYDAVAEESYGYLVMEYVAGGTLEPYCQVDHLLPLRKVVEIIFKSTRALEFAERHGVIHRDIKPANILVNRGTDIKITDFGCAVQQLSDTTQIVGVGSPAYMSPEQVREMSLTSQTDIYSLGVVMYQLLTGRLPFNATNNLSLSYQILNIEPPPPSTHRADLPPELDRIVMRALAKEPGARHASWLEFGKELAAVFNLVGLALEVEEEVSDTLRFSIVRSLSFFQDFSDVEVWETLRFASWRRMAAGEEIIREGEQGDCFYVLVDGRVDVTREGTHLNTLQPGDCFGEMLYFASATARRSTTITAGEPSSVIEIKAAALNRASDPCQVQFNRAFLRILIERLGDTNRRLTAAKQRLAAG